MARNILQTVVILICINYIDGQYFDILQALQPFIQTQAPQTFNFYSDVTTKRPKPKRPSTDNTRNTDSRRVVSEEKKRKQINPPIFETNFFSTTQKIRTTKSPLTGVIQSQSRQDSPKSVNKSKGTSSRNDARNNDPGIIYFEDNLTRPSNSRNSPKNDRETVNRPKSTTVRTVKKPNQITSNGNAWYDSNLVTRPPYETTKTTQRKVNKNVYTTHNPLLNRPGVKPPVVNGPPITNRPVTQRPDFNLGPDLSQVGVNDSPKVIAGPDEDSMTAVERKRHIDVAERMCDKYKAMNMKQVHAIPLVPSPQPVKVNVSSCAPTTVPLVVGGRVVTIEEFPHMALVGWLKTKNRGYAWKCGGSLLSNQFILTAGHCAYQDRDDSVIAGPPRVVQLGSSYLNDPKAVVKKVAAVIRHPKYKQPKAYYDLSILKMASTVTFSDKIKPACLGVPPQPNQPILATGWGRTEFGGSQSDELRSVSIPIWEMDECHSILGISMKLPYGPSSDSQICAGERRGGKDTCQGDSGGPAQIQDGCTWRVVAVTSVGRSCGAAETPAIYATVQRAFISAVVFGNQAAQNDNSRRDVQATNNNRGTNEATSSWNNNRDVQATNNNRGTNNWNTNTNVQATSNNRGTNQAASSWNSNRDAQATSNNRGTNNWNTNTNVQATNNNRDTNQATNGWNSNRDVQATNNNRGTNQPTSSWNNNRDVQATNNNRDNQDTNSWNSNRDVQVTNNNRGGNQAVNNWSNNRDVQATNNNRNVNQQATNNNKDIYQANNQRNENNWNSNNGQNFNRQNNDYNTQSYLTNPSIADSSVNVNNQEKGNNWSNDKENYNQNNYNTQTQRNEYNYNVYTTEASNYNARPETYEFYNPVRETGSDKTDYSYGASNNYNRETYDTGSYYNNDRNVWWT